MTRTYIGVDRNLIRMGQSFGLRWTSIVRKIIVPGAQNGIGAYILMAGALFAVEQLIAGVAILSVLGLTIGWLISRAERRFLRWRA